MRQNTPFKKDFFGKVHSSLHVSLPQLGMEHPPYPTPYCLTPTLLDLATPLFDRRETGEIVGYLYVRDKKQTQHKCRLTLQLSLQRGSRSKTARAGHRQCTQLQISSKSVHFRRSFSQTREHRQNAA